MIDIYSEDLSCLSCIGKEKCHETIATSDIDNILLFCDCITQKDEEIMWQEQDTYSQVCSRSKRDCMKSREDLSSVLEFSQHVSVSGEIR
jgi:hypothetical protein